MIKMKMKKMKKMKGEVLLLLVDVVQDEVDRGVAAVGR